MTDIGIPDLNGRVVITCSHSTLFSLRNRPNGKSEMYKISENK
jgi:hypothetical protein